MTERTADELRDALRPIVSLIRKSEKAQRKLAPGTWQHARLRDNLAALRVAVSLMQVDSCVLAGHTRDDLQNGVVALAAMAGTTAAASAKHPPGTPQHTLLQNRLAALRVAEDLWDRALHGLDA